MRCKFQYFISKGFFSIIFFWLIDLHGLVALKVRKKDTETENIYYLDYLNVSSIGDENDKSLPKVFSLSS